MSNARLYNLSHSTWKCDYHIVAILKGKSSSWIKKKTRKFPRGSLWNRGYFVSTAGLDEYQVRNYIKNQHHHQVDLIQSTIF